MDKCFKAGKCKYLYWFAFFVALLLLTFICAAPETVFASESQGLDINASIGDLDVSVSTDDSANGLSSTLQILILLPALEKQLRLLVLPEVANLRLLI